MPTPCGRLNEAQPQKRGREPCAHRLGAPVLTHDNCPEIIHIGQAIMTQKGSTNSLLYFINTTFNYPTMAEAYRVAALNGYNRIF